MNILPCPFCGKEIFDVYKKNGATTIACDNGECEGIAEAKGVDFNDAVKLWNFRLNEMPIPQQP